VKTMINNWFKNLRERENICPTVDRQTITQPYVNFNELLLTEGSRRKMISGFNGPRYGNTIPKIWKAIQDEFLEINGTTGLASMNDLVIDPLTRAQSGIEGRLFFPDNLFDVNQSLVIVDADIALRIYDVMFENLDTIGTPLSLLEPVDGEPYMLENTAAIGMVRPLRVGANLYFLLGNDGK